MTQPVVARPFVKWAGGKSSLSRALLDIFPRRIRTYYEPFTGAGAVFFALSQDQGRCKRFVLNDVNKELINAYRVIRDFPDELMKWLREREVSYENAPKAIYDAYRKPDKLLQAALWGPIERAGRFIFLNKAGFNGLYRVNRKGEYNVPWGKRATIRTFDEANIRRASELLNGFVRIHSIDFDAVLSDVQEGDLVYFDPPYVPVNATAKFTSYTRDGFTMDDQRRVAEAFKRLAKRGIPVVLSNSDTPEVRELYAGYEICEVQARRNINSKAEKRGPVGELIIVGRRAPQRYLEATPIQIESPPPSIPPSVP
jgi:DNA adenine methylase